MNGLWCQVIQALCQPMSAAHRADPFGSAANLNIHLHCLVLEGVYRSSAGVPVFLEARSPTVAQLQALT